MSYDRLTPRNAALLLIDQQAGLSNGVQSFPEYITSVTALVKLAKAFELLTVITASAADGPDGPILPVITQTLPDSPIIHRPGEINAWDNKAFVKRSKEPLNDFFVAFDLPKEFRKGTLQIDAEVDLGERRIPLARPANVERVEAHAVKSPVEGRWLWKNGPGELDFHTHYHYPSSGIATISSCSATTGHDVLGDPNKNESHFAWDKPFRCIEDGKVTAVIDDVPDNFGKKVNPANTPTRNSSIVVKHPGGSFSIYNHPRRGSAAVKVGQTVKAGDVLGRVGNAGFSSAAPARRLHDHRPDRSVPQYPRADRGPQDSRREARRRGRAERRPRVSRYGRKVSEPVQARRSVEPTAAGQRLSTDDQPIPLLDADRQDLHSNLAST